MKMSELERRAFVARVLKLELKCESLEKSNAEMQEQVVLLTGGFLRMSTILKLIIAKCPTAQRLFEQGGEDDAAKAGKAKPTDMLPSAARTDPSPAATAQAGDEQITCSKCGRTRGMMTKDKGSYVCVGCCEKAYRASMPGGSALGAIPVGLILLP